MPKGTYLYLLSLLFISCSKSQNKEAILIYSDSTLQLYDAVQLDEQLYCIGGNLWESGIVLKYNLISDSIVVERDEPHSLLAIAKHENQISTIGLANQKLTYRSGEWLSNDFDSTYIRRGICFFQDHYAIVGGQAYFQGYVEIFNEDNELVSFNKFPHQLNDIVKFANNDLLAVGYGAMYRSNDQGFNWELLDLEGDFFQSIYYDHSQDKAYILGQTGLLYEFSGSAAIKKLENGGDLGNNFRDLAFKEDRLFRVGDKGLLEYSLIQEINWTKLDLNIGSNILGIHMIDEDVYLFTESGEIFKVKI